jgi:Zn-dependent M28 family amino/carboxypeptidase
MITPSRRYIPPLLAVLIIYFALAVSAGGAEKNSSYQAALESITADDLGRHVEHLADESLEGREAGRRGGLAAAEYLVAELKRMGLPAAGTDDKHFQTFPPNFRNVLAKYVGGDAILREEYIVVCAHFDHVGYGYGGASRYRAGYVHPGADDNASGVAAVLEVAEALGRLDAPPKRSILLAFWDAEEKGLLGSKYWTSHPTVPLEKVVAALNADMIGRLREDRLLVFGSRSGAGWRRLLSFQNEQASLRLAFPSRLQPNADNYPFFEHGIPSLMFHTGVHDEYHTPADLPETIEKPGMSRIARLLFAVAYELADRPEPPPEYRAAARHESPESLREAAEHSAEPAGRLGVGWVEDAAKAGGVLVDTVAEGSAAEQAGFLPGDVIVRFDGRDIAADDDFYAAVSEARSPAIAVLNRPGQEKPLELSVRLEGKPLRWGITWRVDDAEPGAVIVSSVVRGSPAARAGLKPGDRIYRAAARDFADEAAFARLLQNGEQTIQLLIEREGRLRIITMHGRGRETVRRAA